MKYDKCNVKDAMWQCNVTNKKLQLYFNNAIWQMECDKCNLTNATATWHMQCDKGNIKNAMWHNWCEKCNVTHAKG